MRAAEAQPIFMSATRRSSMARCWMCWRRIPTSPRSSRAGWGFMVLTNMLPNQGNGTYVFYA